LHGLDTFRLAAASAVGFSSGIALWKWGFNKDVFNSLLINPVTAICFILCGAAVIILSHNNQKPRLIVLAKLFSIVVILFALTKLFHYFNFPEGILNIILLNTTDSHSSVPGLVPMQVNSAFSFLLLGVSLLVLSFGRILLSQLLAFVTTVLSLLWLIGYVHDMPEFYIPFQDSIVTLATAGCFLFISMAALLVRKEEGYMAEIISPYSGGKIARRLLPLLLFAPVVLELLRIHGERSGLYSWSFGIMLFFCVIMLIAFFIIFYSVTLTNRDDLRLRNEIDEREKAQIEIKNNNIFLETIVENIPNMIFVKRGKDLRFAALNKAGEQLLGISRNDYIGKSDDDIFPAEQAAFFKQRDWEVFKSEDVVVIDEEPISTKNGIRWLRTKKIPVKDETGSPLYLVGISEDITEQKAQEDKIKQFYSELEQKVEKRTEELSKSERRFRALIENSTDCISITNVALEVIYEAPAVARITGYGMDERTDRPFFADIHPDDLKKCDKLYNEVIKNPDVPVFHQYRMLHKNGSYIWIEGTATNLLDDESVKAIVFNYRDVTERKIYEQERDLLIQQLTRHNQDLRQFSYITSHNLRAPLSNLLGLLGLIKYATIEDSSLKEIIEGFNVSANSLNDTLDDLLKVLYIKENTAIERENILVHHLFNKVRGQVANLIAKVEPEILVDIASDYTINFNRAYLESILLNLLTNAIKYRSGKRRLQIKIMLEDVDNKAVVTFEDNGIGIDLVQYKSKIFGLYQRFHTNSDSKGLGLYLVKSQVEALGGSIEVESTVGSGTRFTLTFNKAFSK